MAAPSEEHDRGVPAMRGFLYLEDPGLGHLEQVKRQAIKRAEDRGIYVLETFIEDGSSTFQKLLDALWRNDGAVLVLDAAEGHLAGSPEREIAWAQIGATSARTVRLTTDQDRFP